LPEKKAGAAPQQPASSSPTSAGARDLATILEELHVEPGRAVDGVDEGAFAASIVEQWHRAASAALRREFRNDLGLYAAFRAGIRDGTLPGYDTETGEKLKRRDPVLNAVAEAAAEDKAAGVDPRLPVEARARQVWDVTPSIRAAFEKWGGFESFLEWRRRTERSRA
jgi:hypothetical protein